MLDHGPPINGAMLKSKACLRLLGAGFHAIGADDEPRAEIRFVEAITQLIVGAAVGLAHPPHANDTNANLSFHR
jgi:hypothetical protein